MQTQTELVKQVVYRLSFEGGEPKVEVTEALNEVLRLDLEEFDGQVFHQGQTPRASARRALYGIIDNDTLLVKDGLGVLRFRLEALKDVILQGDAWEVLRLIPSGSMKAVIADPPWTHLDVHRAVGTTTRMTSQTFYATRDVDVALMKELSRVLRDDGYLCLYVPPLATTSHDIWLQVLGAAKEAGLTAVREVVWKKARSMGYRWTGTHEPIFCFVKNPKKLPPCGDRSAVSFVEHSGRLGKLRTPYTDFDAEGFQALVDEHGSKKGIPKAIRNAFPGQFHDTEKPVEVADHLLRVAGEPGQFVLEVFAGTGHACVAAKKAGMFYVAVEGESRTVRKCLAPRLRESLTAIVEVQA